MAEFLVRRLLQAVVVLLGVLTLLFFALRVTGDPVVLLAGDDATPQAIASLRASLGLDENLVVQYGRFIGGVAGLNFGDSILSKRDALGLVWDALPSTLLLSFCALIFGMALAVPIGIYSALRRNSVGSGLAMGFALLGQSVPSFWMGLMLILLFAVNLRWLPAFGIGTPAHLILPTVTLSTFIIARQSRLIRAGMLEVLGQDYVRTARAKGLSGAAVVWRHALKNTLIPVVTVMGLDIAYLIGGSVVIESVFSMPGMGRQLIQAVNARDYPVVQATIFVVAIMVIIINLAIDVAYARLDPRIRLS